MGRFRADDCRCFGPPRRLRIPGQAIFHQIFNETASACARCGGRSYLPTPLVLAPGAELIDESTIWSEQTDDDLTRWSYTDSHGRQISEFMGQPRAWMRRFAGPLYRVTSWGAVRALPVIRFGNMIAEEDIPPRGFPWLKS